MTNLNTKDIYIVSDPEGYSIDTLYTKPANEHDLYICGDLTDSTFLGALPDEYMNHKTFNLRNIHRVISDDNCYLTFGNRDLNKIKCAFLCELNNPGNNDKIKNYNEGNISLSEEAYKDLKTVLTPNPNPNHWKENMSEIWFPFWNNGINNNCYDTFIADKYNDNTKYFITRFNKIFGVDCAKDNKKSGTMSADNLLKTISLELGIINNKDKKYEEKDDDFYAFVVLAIYQSMSLKNDSKLGTFDELKTNLKTSVCKGWLYKLFTRKQSQSILYKEINDKIYLFSHGGLNYDVLINSSTNLNILDNINNDVFKMTNIQGPQKGGFYLDSKDKDIVKTISKSVLYENINKINEFIKKNINTIYNYIEPIPGSPNASTTSKRDDQMKSVISLLILSSAFNSDNFNKLLKDIVNPKLQSDISTEDISPIIANGMYNKLRQENKMFVVDGVTETIQLIGHSPNGYGSSVDLFEKGTKPVLRTVLINLDISNSFIGSISSNIDTNNILSKNYCKIDRNNNLYTNTKINFKKEVINPKKFDIRNNMVEILNPENLTNVFVSNGFVDRNEFEYSSSVDQLYPFISETYTIIKYPSSNDKDKEKQLDKVINYNGRTRNGMNIFTLGYNTYLQFNKNLFILSDNDYRILKTLINCIVNDSKDDYAKLVDLTIKLKNDAIATNNTTNTTNTAKEEINGLVKNIVNKVIEKLKQMKVPNQRIRIINPMGLGLANSLPMGLGPINPFGLGLVNSLPMGLGHIVAPPMFLRQPMRINFPMTLPFAPFAPFMGSLFRQDILNSSITPALRQKYNGPTVMVGNNFVNMGAVMTTSLANKYISKNDKVFYNKYMKYKSKYVNLKTELNI
jgi:hypothetical protein